ncbi:alpha/beta hydrolase [Roseibium litorale]|uniref:Alpha/beta hydrolase n=1 Tax=Roseibium litorale TaxID=2803841 RepID=A0ABR9CRS3_9HYPH|nr:alpha/beta hydrolase [Roseibium litorale]MBD8893582.1 alpha/beta hydrolase [Roseibium litorale]
MSAPDPQTEDRLPADLAPEMAALMARVVAEDGPQPDPTTLSPAQGRDLSERSNRHWNLDLPVLAARSTVHLAADASLGSIACRMEVLVPEAAAPGAILFVHGGGFAFCSPETHERCARLLAIESGLPVLVPDYRLAPEHPYPAGLMDSIAAFRQAFEASASAGVKPGPLLVAGDSAGANLALSVLLHEQTAGKPGAAGALLFYGTFDRDFGTPSYRQFAEGPGLTRGKMQRYWTWYAGPADQTQDVLACPLQATDAALSALPPLHLMAAGVDPLLSDSINLTARLEAIGRPERLTIVPGVTHGFLQNTIDLEAAREALRRAGMDARRMAAKD